MKHLPLENYTMEISLIHCLGYCLLILCTHKQYSDFSWYHPLLAMAISIDPLQMQLIFHCCYYGDTSCDLQTVEVKQARKLHESWIEAKFTASEKWHSVQVYRRPPIATLTEYLHKLLSMYG